MLNMNLVLTMSSEILRKLLELAGQLGALDVHSEIQKMIIAETEPTEQRIAGFIEQFCAILENRLRTIIEFGDRHHNRIRKKQIFQYSKGMLMDGTPTIVLNDVMTCGADKYPIMGLILEYDDIDERDKEFERLPLLIG